MRFSGLPCAFRNGSVLREQLKQLGLGLEGAEKENHTVEALLAQFYESQGEALASDSRLLG